MASRPTAASPIIKPLVFAGSGGGGAGRSVVAAAGAREEARDSDGGAPDAPEREEPLLVVEAEGRDRPGLLYSLASALADLGVQINSAHIATYGERAVDAFYLQTADGQKIEDRRLMQAIERRLMTVLGEGAKSVQKPAA